MITAPFPRSLRQPAHIVESLTAEQVKVVRKILRSGEGWLTIHSSKCQTSTSVPQGTGECSCFPASMPIGARA